MCSLVVRVSPLCEHVFDVYLDRVGSVEVIVTRTRQTPGNPSEREESRKGVNEKPRQEYVQGLERGFAVIRAFSPEAPRLTMAQVAQRTGLTRAGARRYLLTLQALGYVSLRDRQFSLTPRLLDLGYTYLSTLDLMSVVQPFMEQVVTTLHESCSVSVLDGHEIVYVARMPAKRIMSINLAVGSRLPAHATSMGKVLLANLLSCDLEEYFRTASLVRLTRRTFADKNALKRELERVRARGWAVADEESEEGVRSVATALFDRNGVVQAAINAAGHSSRVSVRDLERDHLPVLQEAARGITEALGGRPGTAVKAVR